MDKVKESWMQRRWLDFRNGHAVYLAFPLMFINFTVVTFTLAVERLPVLNEIFPSMWQWAGFFICIYAPAAIAIGYIHMKKQIPKEIEQTMENNPYAYKTQPGREQLFGLPASVISYDMQLRGMTMHNQMADALNKAYNVHIEKWQPNDFKNIAKIKTITERLQKGEDIKTIIGDNPL